MTIRPVDLNGMIQRTNDVSNLKQQEDSKPFTQQQAIQTEFSKETMRHLKQVRHSDDAENEKQRFDAREKGSNEYQDNRKKQKKKQTDGKVVEKKATSGIDIKI